MGHCIFAEKEHLVYSPNFLSIMVKFTVSQSAQRTSFILNFSDRIQTLSTIPKNTSLSQLLFLKEFHCENRFIECSILRLIQRNVCYSVV